MDLSDLVFEMQLAALEINDQQVISRVMEQGFGKLIFEGLEPIRLRMSSRSQPRAA